MMLPIIRAATRMQKPPPTGRVNLNHPLALGLQSFHLLGEGGGKYAVDNSGQRSIATVTQNFAQLSFINGYFGPAINFTGSVGAVTCGKYADNPPNWSISAWINYSGGSFGSVIFGKFASGGVYQPAQGTSASGIPQNIGGAGYGLILFNNGGVGLSTQDGTANAYVAYTSTNYFDSKWHHVVVTCSGYANGAIYVDGVKQTVTVGGVNQPSSTSCASNNVTMGCDDSADTGSSYTGKLEACGLWTRTLSATEAQDLYFKPFDLFVPRRQLFSSRTTAAPTTIDWLASFPAQVQPPPIATVPMNFNPSWPLKLLIPFQPKLPDIASAVPPLPQGTLSMNVQPLNFRLSWLPRVSDAAPVTLQDKPNTFLPSWMVNFRLPWLPRIVDAQPITLSDKPNYFSPSWLLNLPIKWFSRTYETPTIPPFDKPNYFSPQKIISAVVSLIPWLPKISTDAAPVAPLDKSSVFMPSSARDNIPPINPGNWVPSHPAALTGRQVAPVLQRFRRNMAQLKHLRVNEPKIERLRDAPVELKEIRTISPNLKLLRKKPPTLT